MTVSSVMAPLPEPLLVLFELLPTLEWVCEDDAAYTLPVFCPDCHVHKGDCPCRRCENERAEAGTVSLVPALHEPTCRIAKLLGAAVRA